jgi:hypothetical protein
MLTRWTRLIQALEPNHPYLASFGPTIDEIVTETLRGADIKVPPFKYPPILVEPLIGDVSQLLDRCVQYRTLASELEIAAVQHALTRELDVDLNSIDSALAEIVSLAEEYEAHAKRQATVAEKYNPGMANPGELMTKLLSGKMEEAKSSADGAEELKELEAKKLLKIRERLARVKQASDAFHARVQHPGSAHNFQERFDRTMVFFKEDLIEAYHKALCVRIGLKSVYGVDEPLPPITDQQFLDNFLLWTRRVLRHMEDLAEQETEIDFVLPIRFSYRLGGGGALVQNQTYVSTMQDERDVVELSFMIPADVFAGLQKVRLRSVGLSVTYTGADSNLAWKQNRVHAMEVVAPPMVMDDGAVYYRPTLVFRNVRLNSPEMGVDLASSSAVHNLDPASRFGWKLRVRRSVIQLLQQNAEDRRQDLAYGGPNPHNICLHLTVAAVPQSLGFRTANEVLDAVRSEDAVRRVEEAASRLMRAQEHSEYSEGGTDGGGFEQPFLDDQAALLAAYLERERRRDGHTRRSGAEDEVANTRQPGAEDAGGEDAG